MGRTPDHAITSYATRTRAQVPLSPLVFLRATLWFDPQRRTLLRKRRSVRLTSQEARILTWLLAAPGCYLTATLLADWLSSSQGKLVFEHSVEQTICSLRQKLGESGKRPRLIHCQRGDGYAIFPEKAAQTEQMGSAKPGRVRRERPLKF